MKVGGQPALKVGKNLDAEGTKRLGGHLSSDTQYMYV